MAMLGTDDYLCEACKWFNTDGIDGNHPFCTKQMFSRRCRAIRVDEKCTYGFEAGVPSGYPVSMERNERRAREIWAKLGIEVER